MIDPKTLCNPPGRTRDDPSFVTRDYSVARHDNAARNFFICVAAFILLIDLAVLFIIVGRLLSW